ncbi:DUF192 domain-containing protein [Candidatus Bathyarchaeota archaeon]|nr:DUF192 domain-containing protein [Desulfobacterales bacterium]NIU81610.1 DUF192 domain-containing protein [Candidatus Bathyarchaeota archaeon]
MRAQNLRSLKFLGTNVSVADTVPKRIKGLLGRDILQQGEGLWIKPCNWIHTCGMRFPIDIVYVNHDNTVVAIKENIPPNSFTFWVPKAKSVVELPAGTISLSSTEIGDTISFTET